jgi:hypothetical protein
MVQGGGKPRGGWVAPARRPTGLTGAFFGVVNGADAAVFVLDGEVSEHEVRLDRVLDEFVVTMILVLTSEGACPPGAPHDFAAGHDLHAAPGRGPVTLSRGADIVSHRGGSYV